MNPNEAAFHNDAAVLGFTQADLAVLEGAQLNTPLQSANNRGKRTRSGPKSKTSPFIGVSQVTRQR